MKSLRTPTLTLEKLQCCSMSMSLAKKTLIQSHMNTQCLIIVVSTTLLAARRLLQMLHSLILLENNHNILNNAAYAA